MAIDKATLKEMVGKRITIDGNKHRVEKVVMKTGLIVTRDGVEALAEGVYKKGPGFFYDSPTKGKKKPAAAAAEPVKETARARRAREKEEAEAKPKETARERRAREKLEAAEPKTRRSAADKTPGAKGDGKTIPGKKKKLFEAFDQAIAERISQESFDLLAEAYGGKGDYAITPVAVGAAFDNDALKITITVMSSAKSAKEIKSYIRDHREATDIASDDEEDDDLDDDDLEDDDADDNLDEDDDSLEDDEEEDEEDAAELNLLDALNELTLKDLRKIAKEMEIDDYKDFTKEDLAQELSEYEDDDVREAAVTVGVELSGDEEEEEDDDSDEDEEDDEDDDSEDEPETAATVEDLVGEVLEVAPELKAASITKFVEAFLANDECQEKFDGELVPGRTKLQEKGGKGPEMLLIGFDEAGEAIKLLNLTTLKTRSKTISEVVHMEVLDDAE